MNYRILVSPLCILMLMVAGFELEWVISRKTLRSSMKVDNSIETIITQRICVDQYGNRFMCS